MDSWNFLTSIGYPDVNEKFFTKSAKKKQKIHNQQHSAGKKLEEKNHEHISSQNSLLKSSLSVSSLSSLTNYTRLQTMVSNLAFENMSLKEKVQELEEGWQRMREAEETAENNNEAEELDLRDLPLEDEEHPLEDEFNDEPSEQATTRPTTTVAVKSYKEDIPVQNVPHDYTLIHHSNLSRLENKSKKLRAIMKQTSGRGCYAGTKLGQRLYAASCVLSPQVSFHSQELTIALCHAALLANSKVDQIDYSKIPKNTPSRWALQEYIKDLAADTTFLAKMEIVSEAAKVFLLCDKGAKKGANAHFVKILCWWSKKHKTVKTFNLDTDDSDGKSADGAAAVKHALQRMFGSHNRATEGMITGQATDSGGGGTGQSFHRQLHALGLTAPVESYTFSYCSLHCIQLTLSNAIKFYLGEGGINKNTGNL